MARVVEPPKPKRVALPKPATWIALFSECVRCHHPERSIVIHGERGDVTARVCWSCCMASVREKLGVL